MSKYNRTSATRPRDRESKDHEDREPKDQKLEPNIWKQKCQMFNSTETIKIFSISHVFFLTFKVNEEKIYNLFKELVQNLLSNVKFL